LFAFTFFYYAFRQETYGFKQSLRDIYTQIAKRPRLILQGLGLVIVFALLSFVFLSPKTDAIHLLGTYSSLPLVVNKLLRAFIFTVANILMVSAFITGNKDVLKSTWAVPLYAVLASSATFFFFGDTFELALLYFLAYLIVGYALAANSPAFAFGFFFAFNLLPSNLVCSCLEIISGIFAFSGVAEMGYTPAFLYSFQIVAMGLVAAYYGRLAYIMNLGKDFVDRGYMMVTDKHGVETPMLRSTYQYSVMKEIKPWIAITEADKKRRRGRAIMQELQKGWSFYEVFNAQGECLTHGFIDANMDISHLPKGYLQDNRPKLAVAWELDTDALYYLRVEFEGETLYGALRMYSYEADHKRMAHDVSNRLYNTWIHPNEEEILTCTLYKASGEEVLVKSLYGKYHEHCSF
jgi:hypothetical protein